METAAGLEEKGPLSPLKVLNFVLYKYPIQIRSDKKQKHSEGPIFVFPGPLDGFFSLFCFKGEKKSPCKRKIPLKSANLPMVVKTVSEYKKALAKVHSK